MAELTAPETTADACCAPEQQASCCEPSAKAGCCEDMDGATRADMHATSAIVRASKPSERPT
jgi:hypothetical protein